MIAGPSEVLILADSDGNPDWIAADLLAQAEHDAARAVDPDHRRRGARRRGRAGGRARSSTTLPRARDRRRVLARLRRDHPGRATSTRRCRWSMRIAPEHLEIETARRRDGSPAQIRNAGAIFLGAHTPEAIGDYVGGSNHVLPTARSARFSSGLGVLDFMKRTSILKCGPEQLARARAGGDRARRGRGPRRPCALGRDPPQPAMTRRADQPMPTAASSR